MAQRKFAAALSLAVIVPLIVSTIILIIIVMVLPNYKQRDVMKQNTQSTGSKNEQQVSPSSNGNKSYVLFIVGITFACSLFVFLIVIIAVVCIWVRKGKGYIVKDQNCEITKQVYSNPVSQLIKDTVKQNENDQAESPPNTIKLSKDQVISFTTTIPGTSVTTVAVPTQVNLKSSTYGTLGRTHLLSIPDEDGYHIDNEGYDSEETDLDILPSNNKQYSPTICQNKIPNVNKSNRTIESPSTEGKSITPSSELDITDQGKLPPEYLSKQDSFQGLPPLKSFDKYLTLVRLDSEIFYEETHKTGNSTDKE